MGKRVDTKVKVELRLRMYVRCSECALLIDLAEGNRPQRNVDAADMVRHKFEEHAIWLELLGIPPAE
jgi:hypothetical protein